MSYLIFKVNFDNEIVTSFAKRMTAMLNKNSTHKNIGVYFETLEDGTVYQIYKDRNFFEKQYQYVSDNIEEFMSVKIDPTLLPIGNNLHNFPFPENGLQIHIESVNDNAKSLEFFKIMSNTYSSISNDFEFNIDHENYSCVMKFKTKEAFAIYSNILNQRFLGI